MNDDFSRLSCEIDLQPGEHLHLPEILGAITGPGRWRLTVEPVSVDPVRAHSAFLNSYAPEDEGLYDDDTGR